jgi:hypothetical protein
MIMNTSIGMEFSGFFHIKFLTAFSPLPSITRHFVLNVMHIFVNVQVIISFFAKL